MMTRYEFLAALFFILSASCLQAASPELEEMSLQYGLVGTYRSGEQEVVQVDPDIAFTWNNSHSHPAISSEKFQVEWTGQLLVRADAKYTFTVMACGAVDVVVDETSVLKAKSDKPAWIAGEAVAIEPGFHEFKVAFKASSPTPMVKLYWSSEQFELEPISETQLFHGPVPAANLAELGRQLFEGHRCHRCHQRPGDEGLLPAPSLRHAKAGLTRDWMIAKLVSAPEEHDKMPHFSLSEDEAVAVTDFVRHVSQEAKLGKVPKPKINKNAPSGEELLYSLGCVSCHQIGDIGSVSAYSGGKLSEIAAKRSDAWLFQWLKQPEKLNPDHRMPVFQLTDSERVLLVQELSKLGKRSQPASSETDSATEASIDKGRALVQKHGCTACHEIPTNESETKSISLWNRDINWDSSCLKKSLDQPHYPQSNADAIRAYVNSLGKTELVQESKFDLGRHTLQRKNCLACHRRGSGSGNTEVAGKVAQEIESLRGKPQVMLPPSLTAVGDKLRDNVLIESLAGKQGRARADWLKVRMPQFQHNESELSALKHYLVEHDRIPDEGVREIPEVELSHDELLLAGRRLVGAGGLSCIACHQIGDYVPRNVAIGTRGSNLLNIQKRIRPEFYHRWTRNPLRVVPGMEMPAYQKPVPGLLNDNIRLQLTALWNALGDEKFEPPTNPTQVEQLLFVNQGEPAKIVRDVFTVDKENGGGYVPRAFALGLDSQHSLLLDLDEAAVRGWTFGHFARQRTEGKSWYWDLAGTNVATGFETAPDFVLMDKATGKQVELQRAHKDRLARLQSYQHTDNGVELQYAMDILWDGTPLTIQVTEEFNSTREGDTSGWERKFKTQGVPDGFELAYRQPKLTNARFGAAMSSSDQALQFSANASPINLTEVERKTVYPPATKVTTLPGYTGIRIPVTSKIMPTAFAWDANGHTVFTSLDGHVYRLLDSDQDGIEDKLELIRAGLSAPFGVLADGDDLIVTHKPEMLRLKKAAQGYSEETEVALDGWGFNDNYHDWVTGPVPDGKGNLFIALGSDYAQPKRPTEHARWRGKVLKIDSEWNVTPFAHELRYPIGIAFDANGNLFTSDQQGVQNTYNEINHIEAGHYYGVPSQTDLRKEKRDPDKATLASVQIPHPWTRSVNGIFFLPVDTVSASGQQDLSPFAGHGIGCEFNTKFLIRFTYQEVNGQLQGATYAFSEREWKDESETFLNPISGAVAPNGDIYIGSLNDSGWLGGLNTGEIVRLQHTGDIPNGIKEVQATAEGFVIHFVDEVDAKLAEQASNYSITGATRVWKGSYATDDSGTYTPKISEVQISKDRRSVILKVADLRERFVYEINVKKLTSGEERFFPSFAAYTMNSVPK